MEILVWVGGKMCVQAKEINAFQDVIGNSKIPSGKYRATRYQTLWQGSWLLVHNCKESGGGVSYPWELAVCMNIHI